MDLASYREAYRSQGFVLVSGIFERETVAGMIDHYMAMRAEGPKPGDFGGGPEDPDDPTHRYPRLINMHAWDRQSLAWAEEPRLLAVLESLIDDKPVLNQTMLYFKPPGGRGQGLHQDQQYITIEPLVGVWVALEKSDRQVGCMTVVPGSHRGGLLEVEAADTSQSFTGVKAVLPPGAEEVALEMEPGDVLFFHGKTVHGSYKNTSADRWRRSFICHFVGESAERFEPDEGTHISHLKR